MKKITLKMCLLIAAVVLQMFSVEAAVRYVKSGSTGDGTSWQNAVGDLQKAIEASEAGDEVWVAAGTYKPDSLIKSTKKTSKSFMIKNGVSLYGGFAGTETSKDQRALVADGKPYEFVNATILSADDDVADEWTRELQDGMTYRYAWKVTSSGNVPGTENNSCHVLYAASTITTPVEVNGFTLTGAHANQYQAKAAGGALYAAGNVKLTACQVIENSAWYKAESMTDSNTYGGAVYLKGSEGAEIKDCYFARCYSHSSYGNGVGGAIYAKNVTISNCEFVDCVGLDGGGAVYNDGGTVKDCLFTQCYGSAGGAIYNNGVATNNKIFDCRGLNGGGVLNLGTLSYTIVANCYADAEEFGDDMGGQGGGIYNRMGNTIGSVVYNNKAFKGAGIFVREGKVVNCTSQHNVLRAASDEANIGYYDESAKLLVFNTIGNPDAEDSNFEAPTSFKGNATTKADSLAIRDASWALKAGSSFIDAGTATDGIEETVDIAGNPRVNGAKIDVGAYEFTGSSAIANPVVDKEVKSECYYDLAGRSIKSPEKGVFILVKKYVDGSMSTEKVVR